jgi:WD40 repeat protein
LETSRQIDQLHGDWDNITSLFISSDNTLLVGARRRRTSAAKFELATSKAVTTNHEVIDSCASGSILLTRESLGRTTIREASSDRVVLTLPFADPPADSQYVTFSCSSDGRLALFAAARTPLWQAQLWDLQTGKQTRSFGDPAQPVRAAALSRDGKLVATASGSDLQIHVWEALTGKEVRALSEYRDFVERAHRDSSRNAGGSRIWSLVFSPDGTLVAGGGEKASFVWDIATGKQIAEFYTGQKSTPTYGAGIVTYAGFSPDSKRILIAEASGDVRVYNIVRSMLPLPPASPNQSGTSTTNIAKTVTLRAELTSKVSRYRTSLLSPDGRYLFSILSLEGGPFAFAEKLPKTESLPATYIDLKTGRTEYWMAQGQAVTSIAFTVDRQRMAVGHSDGSIVIWDLALRRLLRTFNAGTSPVTALGISAHGHWILAGYRDGAIHQIDIASNVVSKSQAQADFWADDVRASPDDRYLLLSFSSRNGVIVDLTRGTMDRTALPAVGVIRLARG